MTLADAAGAWVRDLLGSPVLTATRLTGGVSSRMLLLRTWDGRETVLRQLVDEPYRRHAAGLLTREQAAHEQMAGTGVPAPRTLGLDPSGDEAGDPSLLMTTVPGAIDLVEAGPSRLEAAAGRLVSIHAVEPDPAGWPREYQSWAAEAKMSLPPTGAAGSPRTPTPPRTGSCSTWSGSCRTGPAGRAGPPRPWSRGCGQAAHGRADLTVQVARRRREDLLLAVLSR